MPYPVSPVHRSVLIAGLALALLIPGLPLEADESKSIEWIKNLPEAFQTAKDGDLPLMICINSARVDGGRFEPAARELRTATYRHADVVALSKKFVCAFLTAEGTSDDFGELRLRYGIDGDIVSPQHIFAYPSGKLMFRKEYWPYGRGQRAVDKLLEFMKDALERDRKLRGKPPIDGEPGPGAKDGGDDVPTPEDDEPPPAPEGGEERAKWIAEQLAKAQSANEDERRAALRALVEADRNGDTITGMLELLDEMKKHPSVRIDITRALGRPGIELAVKPLTKLLGAKELELRANAAVSLEYIGSAEAIADLRKRAAKEDDEGVANHMYRALGRCGAGDAKVRSFLVKKAQGGKSHRATYGPIIGLAYFQSDPKTARAVEKMLKKEGIPGGRGAWRGGAKRALLVWCLTEVGFGDPKSAKFVRDVLIPMVMANAFVSRFVGYYQSAEKACEGDEEARQEVGTGTARAVNWGAGGGFGGGGPGGAGGTGGGGGGGGPLMDDARRGREDAGFTPKPTWSK